MDKKLQVFISSTYEDLIEERRAAIDAILDSGHIPVGMELFKAGKPILNTIYNEIDDADVYLLILGGKYGSIEESSKKGYTQLEYEYAKNKGMQMVTIVLTEDFIDRKATAEGEDMITEKDNKSSYLDFKKTCKDDFCKFADNIEQLKAHIISQLSHIYNEYGQDLIGYVKGINRKRFRNIDEVDSYIAERIVEAKNCIFDLTWKDNYPGSYIRSNHRTYLSTQDRFLEIIKSQLAKGVSYQHIFTFPYNKKERIAKMEKLIQYDNYTCGFFESNNDVKKFPKLNFIIIDDEEVIFASSDYDGSLCSIRDNALIGILKRYFTECWSMCLKIKDYDGVNDNILKMAKEDSSKE